MRQDLLLSDADLESMGFSNPFIQDYQGFKREVAPQFGTEPDPNGIYAANLNGTYFDMSGANAVMWVNGSPGEKTGWKQVL